VRTPKVRGRTDSSCGELSRNRDVSASFRAQRLRVRCVLASLSTTHHLILEVQRLRNRSPATVMRPMKNIHLNVKGRILLARFSNEKEEIMAKPEQTDANTLNPAQKDLSQLWEDHVRYEFSTRNTDDTLATMVDDAYVNHIPVLTGGSGREELREFYSKRFIPQMPPDTEMTPVSQTIGEDQIVDEMIFKFTHTIPMDWMLPGIPPTGKRVEVPLVAIVRFKDGKLAHEHIYWDQASVLVQIGLIDPAKLPVAGVESARKVLDSGLPANALMRRADLNQ